MVWDETSCSVWQILRCVIRDQEHDEVQFLCWKYSLTGLSEHAMRAFKPNKDRVSIGQQI